MNRTTSPAPATVIDERQLCVALLGLVGLAHLGRAMRYVLLFFVNIKQDMNVAPGPSKVEGLSRARCLVLTGRHR